MRFLWAGIQLTAPPAPDGNVSAMPLKRAGYATLFFACAFAKGNQFIQSAHGPRDLLRLIDEFIPPAGQETAV